MYIIFQMPLLVKAIDDEIIRFKDIFFLDNATGGIIICPGHKTRRFNLDTITIYDVAKEAGVSPRTVGRFFKAPEKLAKKTAERIDNSVKKLKYRPNVYANRVSRGKQDVSAVMAYLKDDYILDNRHQVLLSYLSHQFCLRGKDLLLILADKNTEQAVIKESLKQKKFDSLLLLNIPGEAILEELKECSFPKISINWRNPIEIDEHLSVQIDHYQAAVDMTEFLIGKSYKHFAYVGPHFSRENISIYGEAMFDTLRKKGNSCSADFIQYESTAKGSPVERAERVLLKASDMKRRPQVLFCYNDYIAASLISAAAKLKFKIPDDFAITGIDESFCNDYIFPKITTVRHPWKEMAEIAVKFLCEDDKYPEEGSKKIICKHTLIPGESS